MKEKEKEKDVTVTVSGLDIEMPDNPFPIIEEIEPFYKSPYFLLLLFNIFALLFIIGVAIWA